MDNGKYGIHICLKLVLSLCLEVTRRGLGAVLPQKPKKLARLVQGIAAQSPIPLTVKIRIGKDDKSINVREVRTHSQCRKHLGKGIKRWYSCGDWDFTTFVRF
jgi:hypothetical protein